MTAIVSDAHVAPPAPPTPGKAAADAALRQLRSKPRTNAMPSIDWVQISPTMASHWLAASNVNNRRLRRGSVEAYKRTIISGQWLQNPAPISFSPADELLDGQHRLEAISESGKTVWATIAVDVPKGAQEAMDTGMRRTVGDVLNLRDGEYKNGSHLAAAAKLTFDVGSGTSKITARPSQQEIIDIVDQDEVLRWVANERLADLPTVASKATMIYVFASFYKVNADAAEDFLEKITTLVDLPLGSPILALHKRMSGVRRSGTSHRDRVETVVAFFQAWNAWRKGEPRTNIRITPRRDNVLEIPKLVA